MQSEERSVRFLSPLQLLKAQRPRSALCGADLLGNASPSQRGAGTRLAGTTGPARSMGVPGGCRGEGSGRRNRQCSQHVPQSDGGGEGRAWARRGVTGSSPNPRVFVTSSLTGAPGAEGLSGLFRPRSAPYPGGRCGQGRAPRGRLPRASSRIAPLLRGQGRAFPSPRRRPHARCAITPFCSRKDSTPTGRGKEETYLMKGRGERLPLCSSCLPGPPPSAGGLSGLGFLAGEPPGHCGC